VGLFLCVWRQCEVDEWQFPNAIAMHVKRTAELKGQHANRLEIRDPDDKWPKPPPRSTTRTVCFGSAVSDSPTPFHQREDYGPFCRHCGNLIVETR
jgi:hypothetical protein